MLSSVLKSEKAIEVNIAIMQVFVCIREYSLTHVDFISKLKEIETKYDRKFSDVYEVINYLIQKENNYIIDPDSYRERINLLIYE
ncbi:hypothetical protein BH11BAC1_BH11BAC1_11670 [soil metagenome]